MIAPRDAVRAPAVPVRFQTGKCFEVVSDVVDCTLGNVRTAFAKFFKSVHSAD